MKYADSFRHQEVLDTSGTTTYSTGWYTVDFANELYCFLTATETGSATSESVVVTIERASGFEVDVPVTVVTFSTITAATTEEKYAVDKDNSAQGAENKIGHRIRFKFVTSGTWTVDNMTITVNVHAKRN